MVNTAILSLLYFNVITVYTLKLSFVSPNNLSINRTGMLHNRVSRNEEEKEKGKGKWPNKKVGNEDKYKENDKSGADLGPCTCGDHVSAGRALKVGQRMLSEFGYHWRRDLLRGYRNLYT